MHVEAGFLQALRENPRDEVSRLVYADWLEERGDPRGEFLRLGELLGRLAGNPRERTECQRRLAELRPRMDPGWLALVDRTPIEDCGFRVRYACPRRWEYLEPTSEDTVRWCRTCKRKVFHCGGIAEAQGRLRAGQHVAVDSRLVRTQGDLRLDPARRAWWKFW